jgi:hypothetical protein
LNEAAVRRQGKQAMPIKALPDVNNTKKYLLQSSGSAAQPYP